MARGTCSYCGLPVSGSVTERQGRLFCCYGCYLVSRIVGGEQEGQLRSWTILRFSIGAVLAMNVMMIAVLLYTGEVESEAAPTFRWLMLGLSTPAILLLGYPFARGAAGEIRRLRLSLDTLIAAGALAAYGTSALNTVRGQGPVYFDTATMLPVLVTFGKLVETTAKTRVRRLVHGLQGLLPRNALRIESDGAREVPLASLRVGDRVRVRPGERIPVDGAIVEGTTTLDESVLTGESLPRECGPHDRLVAGTVNGPGGIVVAAESVDKDLFLNRVIDMVEDARQAASPAERQAERIASIFVPGVVAVAVLAGVAWLLLSGPARGGMVLLSVIVVACPCAMGIATPLATALAIGRAAREGAIVRGGDVMEYIGRLGVIFFDKTGTVTMEQPEVRAVRVCDPALTEGELLSWAAGLEVASEHALGRAIVAEARRLGLDVGTVSAVEAVPGRGIQGTVQRAGVARRVKAGAPEYVARGERGARDAGLLTVVQVAWDDRPRGEVLLADAVRADAGLAVGRLNGDGIETVLLSGDRREVTDAVARQVGFARAEAPRRPDEKVVHVRQARDAARLVGMVGDGINDAPALAAADVGIALGTGTDLARQAGNVLLVSDRLSLVPWLVGLSRRTGRIIGQNLAWAFGYNMVAIGAAAAGLLHPLLAALAMVFSSLTLLVNSVRIQAFPGPCSAGRAHRSVAN